MQVIRVFVNGVLVHRGSDLKYAMGVAKEWQKHNPDAKVKMVGKRIRK